MVFRFILISDEVDTFMREIKIDADATFLDFHKAILRTCNYKDDQITSFTICENGWERKQDITLEDLGTSSDEDCYLMADTHLRDMLDDEQQHLLYTFDPLAGRVLFINLSEIITRSTLAEPVVSRQKGDAPQQTLDFDELYARHPVVPATATATDESDSMFGDGISEEDNDLDGLDITDGEPF